MAEIWLEAEAFDCLGGWVVDTQSLAQVGSAYLMAHGLGVPVADAETVFAIPQAGRWAVWARTRDWTAPWRRGTSAGRFKAGINGRELPTVLGTNGPDWAWQKAGEIELERGEARFFLRDLTGFNGRCDALYLTTELAAGPADDSAEVAALRRRCAGIVCQDDPTEYDLAVVGGGIAGICTAVAALRSGAKVLLIHDRPMLGGCNSSEVRVGLGGLMHTPPYPNLGRVVAEISPILGGPGTYTADFFEDSRKRLIFGLHPANRYRLALSECVYAVEPAADDPQKLAAVITRQARTGAETRYRARLFADCSGDAVVARLLGASTMYGREGRAAYGESLAPEAGDRQVMGMSVLWYARKSDRPTEFPEIDWGLEITEENVYYIRGGDWEWETGQYRDQAVESEYIRDYGLMAIYANWSFLKNRSRRRAEWAQDELAWVSAVGGKRESHRVVGDYVLTQNDIENRVLHPDGTGALNWSIDLHFPDPENAAKFAEPFRSCAYHRGLGQPYPVPYRCLYARDVRNLFLGGRDLSLSHVAFSSARVQRTLGVLGEVVGLAAGLCTRRQIWPRDVYEKHLPELLALLEQGVPQPVYHAYQCDDSETYHFKELGHLRVHPAPADPRLTADPALRARVAALGVRPRHFPAGF